ncbi:MAG: bifunctional folylpolyglutamate synthase/dihydrofolate synthase [Chroococcales cyanobacterium]
MTIDTILEPFQHFGVNLGLDRIEKLLADLDNPQLRVPIIHVAGTNGKGSVCAYLSAILTAAGYKVGRYTSPHLVNWTERICLNEKPISSEELEEVLSQVKAAVNPSFESPTQFEVITAAAWLYFAQQDVDIAVMEVGLGGRLDATNVVSNPLVSVITSLSLEHWQRLGPTLADIAGEKAGIIKPNCPAVIGILPPEAESVVASRIEELNCPAVWVKPAQLIKEGWAKYEENGIAIEYPLGLPGEVQLINSGIAIATLEILQEQGWNIPPEAIQAGMKNTRWPGRLQWFTWNNSKLLIDGAHNPAAAQALRSYVDSLLVENKDIQITWVMGMLSTKDHADIFKALLRPTDKLYLSPVPDHSSANPEDLAKLAQGICPDLSKCQTFPDVFAAFETAFEANSNSNSIVVFCGSLYLIGHFFKHLSSE